MLQVFRSSVHAMRSKISNVSVTSRKLSTTANAGEVIPYPFPVQAMHWTMGGAMLSCVGLVLAAKQTKGKTKGRLMFLHKSFGLLSMGLLFPRLAIRLSSKIPPPMSAVTWEKMAANITHIGLYGLMIVMPVSGVAMGYFGGKGLPFFYTTLPGAKEAQPAIAKQAFSIHSLMGQVLEYSILAHFGGVAFHKLKGDKIFARIVPWLSAK